jgi:hypothetical protein
MATCVTGVTCSCSCYLGAARTGGHTRHDRRGIDSLSLLHGRRRVGLDEEPEQWAAHCGPGTTGRRAIGDHGPRQHVRVRPGTDNQLWVSACNTTGSSDECGSWLPLGGHITSQPGAVLRAGKGADYSVYARGTDGAVWGRDRTASGWGPWHSPGGNLLAGTGPAAAYLGGTYVLAVGTNKETYVAEAGVTGFVPAAGSTTATAGLTALLSAHGAPAALPPGCLRPVRIRGPKDRRSLARPPRGSWRPAGSARPWPALPRRVLGRR